MASVAIYGAGQLGQAVAAGLRARGNHRVSGPFRRDDRELALNSGADVVLIATTTLFKDVADYIRDAVNSGSNVLVSAEECAYPWAVDKKLADELDKLAKAKRVSIAGAGVNPGLIFDALVATLLGPTPSGFNSDGSPKTTIVVRRTVNISGFGATVLRRIGVGATEKEFKEKVERSEILGHAGFPQSMNVVADALGLEIERIDKELLPVLTDREIDLPERFIIKPGFSAGVNQTYTAIVKGKPWFSSHFFGHVDLTGIERVAKDEIEISIDQKVHQTISLNPGIGAQMGSQNMVINSIERIIQAQPGWVSVAEIAPALARSDESFSRK
jgi:4-hydroxy-tetrahydrodipicolinate reductase